MSHTAENGHSSLSHACHINYTESATQSSPQQMPFTSVWVAFAQGNTSFLKIKLFSHDLFLMNWPGTECNKEAQKVRKYWEK